MYLSAPLLPLILLPFGMAAFLSFPAPHFHFSFGITFLEIQVFSPVGLRCVCTRRSYAVPSFLEVTVLLTLEMSQVVVSVLFAVVLLLDIRSMQDIGTPE